MAVAYLKHGTQQHSQGLLLITDIESGKTLFEGYLRQCSHCQKTWKYRPGSGIRRGFCKMCNGHTCGRSECDACYHKEKRIEDMEAVARRNRAALEALIRQIELKERVGSLKLKGKVNDMLKTKERREAEEKKGHEGLVIARR